VSLLRPLLLALAAAASDVSGDVTAGPDDAAQGRDELQAHGSRAELEHAGAFTSWAFDGVGRRRTELAGRGVTLDAFLTVDASAFPSGGADPGGGAVRGLLDLVARLDLERLLGVRGATFAVGLQAYGGEDPTADVGVVQPLSGIDDPDDRVQLAIFWWEQAWRDGATRLRVGKTDANSLFADVRCALDFVHSSFGNSPTMLGFPTYPESAFGVAARQALGGGASLSAGVFDGAAQEGVRTGQDGPSTFLGEPADLFLIAQADIAWGKDRPGRLALGAWRHTGDFARYDGGADEDGTDGFYAVLEQRLAGARVLGSGEGRALDAFLQLGTADADVSPIDGHVGAGVVASGWLWPARDDVLGLGVSSALLSDEPAAGFDTPAETALELFWALDLVPGVRLQPDLEVVIDPGGDASRDEAWIATLRLNVSL
jgi:porin